MADSRNLQKSFNRYLSNDLTDRHEILYDNALRSSVGLPYLPLTVRFKKIQDGGWPLFSKSKNHISATGRPIAMKFGLMAHSHHLQVSADKISIWLKSNTADGRHLENR